MNAQMVKLIRNVSQRWAMAAVENERRKSRVAQAMLKGDEYQARVRLEAKAKEKELRRMYRDANRDRRAGLKESWEKFLDRWADKGKDKPDTTRDITPEQINLIA